LRLLLSPSSPSTSAEDIAAAPDNGLLERDIGVFHKHALASCLLAPSINVQQFEENCKELLTETRSS
jgi:hypothetical protein